MDVPCHLADHNVKFSGGLALLHDHGVGGAGVPRIIKTTWGPFIEEEKKARQNILYSSLHILLKPGT